MSGDRLTLTVRTGYDGGSAPEVGMPIEHPGTLEDYIIDSIEPDYSQGVLRISTGWEGEALPIYSDMVRITARPAKDGEVAAYWAQRMPEGTPDRPWWRSFGALTRR